MKIIFLTIKKVFSHSDIIEAGNQGNFDDFRKTNGENKMQKEIGSNFWEIEIDENRNNKYWWDEQQYHSEYFVSGRNAILGLCKVLGNEKRKLLCQRILVLRLLNLFIKKIGKLNTMK